jgi:hypothetical protein
MAAKVLATLSLRPRDYGRQLLLVVVAIVADTGIARVNLLDSVALLPPIRDAVIQCTSRAQEA